MCGGTELTPFYSHAMHGLSPRVRGNHEPGEPGRRHIGSIPACAGEPNAYTRIRDADGVYPRVCGGTPAVQQCPYCAEGLSPRVRGNLYQDTESAVNRGSIPACAGEPAGRPRRAANDGVYPRVCGGTAECRLFVSQMQGLSPRVRGNRGRHPTPDSRCRSIPACAGEPRRRPRSINPNAVYPRVCGGTADGTRMTTSGWGLSPRVRGNRVRNGQK